MGKVGQAFMTHIRGAEIPGTGIAPLKYVLPFVTTPYNIFKTAAAKSPLGATVLPYKLYKAAKSEASFREAIRKGTPEAEAATLHRIVAGLLAR